MLVCIPTSSNTGLEAAVSEHFGSAQYFTLFDNTTGEIKVVENRNAHHSHGTCHPMNQLAQFHIDCVVCSGMGRRAIEALSTEGIKVYQAESGSVRELIDQVKAGTLTEIDPTRACRGHGQRAIVTPDTRTSRSGRGSGYGLGGGRRQNEGPGWNGKRGHN